MPPSAYSCSSCIPELSTGSLCPGCAEAFRGDGSSALLPGSMLQDRYRVGRVLGQGGFGITYLVFDTVFCRYGALKECFPRGMAWRSPGATTLTVPSQHTDHYRQIIQDFLHEARSLAKFHAHEGIVDVLDFFHVNNTAYLVMEYLEGMTFKAYLDEKGGRISFADCVRLLKPVMEALGALHQEGLAHRDVAPDNIFLTKAGAVKLVDFGAARFVSAELSQSLDAIHKPGYTPFEQYQRHGKQGPWTDIYALGATIYRALVGQVPVEAPDRMMGEQVLQAPSELGIPVPPDAEQALLKALAIKPGDRYQNLPAFLADFTMSPPNEPDYCIRPFTNRFGMAFVAIPAGSFTMGSIYHDAEENEKPTRQVTVDRGFWMGETEVTQAQWEAVMGNNPSRFKGPKHPVECVNWEDAQTFLSRLNELDPGKGYRLPSEAEWEYACRAGMTGDRYGNLEEVAWYGDNSGGQTHSVKEKRANSWGLYDMLGNVWEWCEDTWHNSYQGAPADSRIWVGGTSNSRVLRGGSWVGAARYCRASSRCCSPNFSLDNFGIRVVVSTASSR